MHQIYYSEPIKSAKIEDGVLNLLGPGVVFTSADQKDLHGEFFTKSTNYWSWDWKDRKFGVVWDHGKDPVFSTMVIGKAAARVTDQEIEVLARIDPSLWGRFQKEKAMKFLAEMEDIAKKGLLCFSSGSNHLTRSKKSGEIVEWPINEFSLTVKPADLKCKVRTFKSYDDVMPSRQSFKAGRQISSGNWSLLQASANKAKEGIDEIHEFLNVRDPQERSRDTTTLKRRAQAFLTSENF